MIKHTTTPQTQPPLDPVEKLVSTSPVVFNNITRGCARILTYEMKMCSIFTLKCHFHSNNKKFTYRSDKFPGDQRTQYQRMIALAEKYRWLTYSMQLYDNRRAAPDDILIKWTAGLPTYQNLYLPFSIPDFSEKVKDEVIFYCNSLKNKTYAPLTEQDLLLA